MQKIILGTIRINRKISVMVDTVGNLKSQWMFSEPKKKFGNPNIHQKTVLSLPQP